MNLNNLEKKLNVNFKNKNLLIRSLTHKSFDSNNNNEKLEFLGDRILGFVIAKKLLELYPNDKEGILDKKLASLVNKKMCFTVCESFELEQYIKTNSSKKKNYKIENKIISDACEAIIGAIFLDQGIKVVERFILHLWHEHIINITQTKVDSKTRLQEFSLKKFKKLPIYKLIENSGPRHKPIFKIEVKIKNTKSTVGKGFSKKDAEQNAATQLLKNINLI
jgi:ribonuclease-3